MKRACEAGENCNPNLDECLGFTSYLSHTTFYVSCISLVLLVRHLVNMVVVQKLKRHGYAL